MIQFLKKQEVTKVLLSIKPEFVDKIFDGTKKYEFRKVLFKKNDISTVIIYSTSPVCSVVGEFHVDEILWDDVDVIWGKTKSHAGISKKFYSAYYSGRKSAVAIKIGQVKKYKAHRKLSDYKISKAPQSFCYLSE